MSKSIDWNDKAKNYTTPLQRDAYERGQPVLKLTGRIVTDTEGKVWHVEGEHRKLIGSGSIPGASVVEGKKPAKKSKKTKGK